MRVVVVVAGMLFCITGYSRNAIEMELIEIPAGKLTMGSPKGENNLLDHEA